MIGILYTMLDVLRVGSVSFTLVSCCHSVLVVVNTVRMSNVLQTLLKSSPTPATYGRQMVYLGCSSCVVPFLGLAAAWMMCPG